MCVGPAGFAALFEVARLEGGLPAVTRINLGLNNIGDETMAAFCAALGAGGFPALKEVRIYRNKFGDAGVKALAGALASAGSSTIQDVYLGMHPDRGR